ncbi:hypothetical protein F5Y13DRAFT_7910 [Hypoxylon sp. FL1857]|nr:hypothetical protein F5Y13DRAFT_7910 [Hypoxylon sp. FL1857]
MVTARIGGAMHFSLFRDFCFGATCIPLLPCLSSNVSFNVLWDDIRNVPISYTSTCMYGRQYPLLSPITCDFPVGPDQIIEGGMDSSYDTDPYSKCIRQTCTLLL